MDTVNRSKARLRTRAGCFECRRRRKKCDEQVPRCGGCCRNGLNCTYPTSTSQPVDRRRRCQRILRRRNGDTSDSSTPQSFQLSRHLDLYQHFATVIAPRLVRQNCLPQYSDQTHMIQLALKFPPLMGVMVAIAALDWGTSYYNELAMESYLFALRNLQDRMALSPDAGDEDGLLATAICLCVFENRRSDAPPNIGVHTTIAGVLLTLRRPTHSHIRHKSTIAFERVCAESFLYHSTLMMLFDPTLDVLNGVNDPSHLVRYFSDSAPDMTTHMCTLTQPILDASYKFFLVIADVTRLGRISRRLNEMETQLLTRLHAGLSLWENVVRDDPGKMLYVLAMRILLLKVSPELTALEVVEQMQALLHEGLLILNTLDVQKFLLGYLLWPLTVFGAIATSDDRKVVKEKISLLVQTRHGQALRAQKRLEIIWASKEGDKETMAQRRLQMLVDGI